MAGHRLLPALLIILIADTMALSGDGDQSIDGGAANALSAAATDEAIMGTAQVDDHEGARLGDSGPNDPPPPLPSKSEDTDALPMDAEDHAIDDAVIDENIKQPTFYKFCNFGGTSVEVETSVPDVATVGISHNDISSLKVPQGFVVTIYSEKGYLGYSKTFTGSSVHCLVNYNMGDGKNWDDAVNSIKVHSAKPPKGKNAAEGAEKEKAQKKGEELAVEKESKSKIKLKEEILLSDQKKAQRKEQHMKDEVSAEAKKKAITRDHGAAVEDEERAKAKQENAKKNEELSSKENEKNTKGQTEKETKHDIEVKREGSAKRDAKEKKRETGQGKNHS